MRRILLLVIGICTSLALIGVFLRSVKTSLYKNPDAADVIASANHISNHKEEQKQIHFPYLIENTSIEIVRTVSYDGPFVEDGSNREVVNALGIILKNVGERGIVQACITMQQGSKTLYFDAETLPPGSSILVLERNMSEYIQEIYTLCKGEEVLSETIWWAKNAPSIQPNGMGNLFVTNNTDADMEEVWIYYKTYQTDPGIYIGGITYKVGIRKLESGKTLEITPQNYAYGYSRIVRVTIG